MTQPEIRFNGFSDEWNIAKLGDVLKISEKVEATVTNNEQLLTVKLHGGGVHVMPSNKLLKLGSTKYYVRKAGQLIYGKQNFFNGSMAIIPLELDGKASSGDVPSFDIVNADVIYLYQKISQPEFYKRTEDWASGTGSKRLHEKTIQQFPIQLPTLLEQQKIGSLFSKYDNIIALREQKLEELNALKKGLLQQMFPENGAKVPELRFAGFADDWVERKLSEGTSKIGDGLHGTPQYTDDGAVFFINGNNLVDGKIVITKETKLVTELGQSKDDKLLNNDTILMSINGTIGNLAWYNNEKIMLGKSAAYLIISEFDKKFIYSYLQTSAVKSYFLNNLTGTTIKNLGLKTIRNTNLFVPIIEEQQKIGQLFKHLDGRISNEQAKIEQLKAQKQGLLQRML